MKDLLDFLASHTIRISFNEDDRGQSVDINFLAKSITNEVKAQ